MPSLSELTVQVLTARLAKRDMSLEELQKEMAAISKQLKDIESGNVQEPVSETPAEEPKKEINFKQIFKKDEVICLICNKGFKTLKRHLNTVHQTTDKEYKAQFGIPAKQALVAKSYSDQKKAFALENKLGDKMQAGKKASLAEKEVAATAEGKAPVPAKRVKAPVPVLMNKAAVPTKTKNK
jgi:predicted transcriptional regulator